MADSFGQLPVGRTVRDLLKICSAHPNGELRGRLNLRQESLEAWDWLNKYASLHVGRVTWDFLHHLMAEQAFYLTEKRNREVNLREIASMSLQDFVELVKESKSLNQEGEPKKSESNKVREPYPSPQNYGRDKWIYESIQENTCDTLSRKLKEKAKQKKWDIISSRNGFKKAADRYADYHSLEIRRFATE